MREDAVARCDDEAARLLRTAVLPRNGRAAFAVTGRAAFAVTGRAAFAVTGRAAFAVTGRAAAPRRVVPMAFMPLPPPPPPRQPQPPPPPPPSPAKAAIEETRTKFLDASAKNGVDSAQALAALKEYEAVLTSQTLVSPRTTPHAARASHTTPYNTAPAIQHQRQ